MSDPLVLTFPQGLPGFADAREFALARLSDDESNPYSVMRLIADPRIAFILADPTPFFPDFAVDVDDSTAVAIDAQDGDALLVLVSVQQGRTAQEATANLLGPFVINLTKALGAQVTMTSDELSSEQMLSLLQVPLVQMAG